MRPRLTPEEKAAQAEKIVKLWDKGEGLTQKLIATRLGISTSVVSDVIREATGLPVQPRRKVKWS